MGVSYMELALLEADFDRQTKDKGIVWTDEEVRDECLNDFVCQYESGIEEPTLFLFHDAPYNLSERQCI